MPLPCPLNILGKTRAEENGTEIPAPPRRWELRVISRNVSEFKSSLHAAIRHSPRAGPGPFLPSGPDAMQANAPMHLSMHQLCGIEGGKCRGEVCSQGFGPFRTENKVDAKPKNGPVRNV